MLTVEQGKLLARLARKAVEDFSGGKAPDDFSSGEKWLSEKKGVFVSLHSFPGNKLRGCVGFPLPVLPLGRAVCEAAASACCDDRFPMVSQSELGKITVEVSVLTLPVEINFKSPKDLLKKLTKKEGVVLKLGTCSGLFLPQVWEQIPDKKDFLDHLCMKACLPRGSWKMRGARVFSFTVQAFAEENPNGKVNEKNE